MPYVIKQKKCTQADGDSGTHTLSYTDGEGTKRDNCHTSEQNAEDQIAAIEGGPLDETDPMMFGGGGFADEEEYGGGVSEVRSLIRQLLILERESANATSPWAGAAAEAKAGGHGATSYRLLQSNPLSADAGFIAFKRKGSGAEAHIRITPNDKAKKLTSDEVKDHLKGIMDSLTGESVSVAVYPKDVGNSKSGSYNTYGVSAPSLADPVYFVVSGVGQRAGGYKYEEDVVSQLSTKLGRDIKATQGTKTTEVDAFVDIVDPRTGKAGKLAIELKAKTPKFGELTMEYDFNSAKWAPVKGSRSPVNAATIAEFLNTSDETKAWMNSIKTAWDEKNPDDPMQVYRGIKPFEEYQALRVQDGDVKFSQSGPAVEVPLTSDPNKNLLVKYYLKKGANYIQLKGKGLYHLDSDFLDLGTTSFADATAGLTAVIKPQILNSDGAKLRPATDLPNLATDLPPSDFDLDNHPDAQAFGIATGQPTEDYGEYELWAHFDRPGDLMSEGSLKILIREMLLLEELTGRDKDEIKRIARKEAEKIASKKEIEKVFQKKFDSELKRALGASWIGTPGKINKFVQDAIAKEIKTMFNDKITQNQIADLSKAVIKKLYRQLSFSSVQIIDRIKL